MSLYEQIYPPAETVLDMEPEELAPIVLKHLSKSGSQKLNMHNFSIGTDPDFVKWAGDDHRHRQEVLQRLIVAWRWLERELFIAPQPGNVDWAFITPRGMAVLESQDFDEVKDKIKRLGKLTFKRSTSNLLNGIENVFFVHVKPSYTR